jgi:hypothetical protein
MNGTDLVSGLAELDRSAVKVPCTDLISNSGSGGELMIAAVCDINARRTYRTIGAACGVNRIPEQPEDYLNRVIGLDILQCVARTTSLDYRSINRP